MINETGVDRALGGNNFIFDFQQVPKLALRSENNTSHTSNTMKEHVSPGISNKLCISHHIPDWSLCQSTHYRAVKCCRCPGKPFKSAAAMPANRNALQIMHLHQELLPQIEDISLMKVAPRVFTPAAASTCKMIKTDSIGWDTQETH